MKSTIPFDRHVKSTRGRPRPTCCTWRDPGRRGLGLLGRSRWRPCPAPTEGPALGSPVLPFRGGLLHNDSSTQGAPGGGPVVAEGPSPGRRPTTSPAPSPSEEPSVNLQGAPKDGTPAVPFKLDLPQENALKSHIYRLMSCSTRIIPLLLSSGTALLNTITHAAALPPGSLPREDPMNKRCPAPRLPWACWRLEGRGVGGGAWHR